MIYYSQHFDYENTELQKINEFKIWCMTCSSEIPDRDEEILKILYATKFNS